VVQRAGAHGLRPHHRQGRGGGRQERHRGGVVPGQRHAHHRQRLHQRQRVGAARRLQAVAGEARALRREPRDLPPQSQRRGQWRRPPQATDHGARGHGGDHRGAARLRAVGADLLRRV